MRLTLRSFKHKNRKISSVCKFTVYLPASRLPIPIRLLLPYRVDQSKRSHCNLLSVLNKVKKVKFMNKGHQKASYSKYHKKIILKLLIILCSLEVKPVMSKEVMAIYEEPSCKTCKVHNHMLLITFLIKLLNEEYIIQNLSCSPLHF